MTPRSPLPSLLSTIALLGAIAVGSWTPAAAGLVLHSTMDNADIGAGSGAENTDTASFEVRDTSGSGTHGTAQALGAAGTINAGVTGILGQQLRFEGGDAEGHVNYGDVPSFGTGDMSVSIWFNPDAIVTTRFLISDGRDVSSATGWRLIVFDDRLELSGEHFGMSVGGIDVDNSAANTTDAVAGWYHAVLTVDNATGVARGYLNGVQVTTDTFVAGSNLDAAGEDLVLGARKRPAGSVDLEFDGGLDDAALFDHALSASEVSVIFNQALNNGLNAPDALATIPEPSAAGLLALGLLGGSAARRRRCR